jgi:hypothetical protein
MTRYFSRSRVILPRWSCRNRASACPDYRRRDAIFRGACVCQIAILAIQLGEDIATCGADPAIIKPADDKRLAICERDNFRRFINSRSQNSLRCSMK